MSKKDKNKKVSKAEVIQANLAQVTGNAKAAQKALRAGKAKGVSEPLPIVPTLSAAAVDGEKPEWSAQLDSLAVTDKDAGMTAKAMRVQREQRVRQLKKGKSLPASGGVLMDLDGGAALTLETRQPEVIEPVAAEPEPEVVGTKLSKKERKALTKSCVFPPVLAVQDEIGNATVGEPVFTNSTFIPRSEPDETIADTQARIATETGPAPSGRTRTDNILVALKQAQDSANHDKRVQVVDLPRSYGTKNYGVQLIKKYAPEGMILEPMEDTFVEPTRDKPKGAWQVHIRVRPQVPAAEAESETPTTDALADGPDVGGYEVTKAKKDKKGKSAEPETKRVEVAKVKKAKKK